ncbi:MAG: DUF3344 domain-containing protein [Polyangia bacterium]
MSRPAAAAPSLRYQVSQRGDMVIFGNTLGYDCRATTPKPVVGTVDPSCGMNTDDNDIDVLWRADDAGTANAGTTITPPMARSTAVLSLPAGAVVTYARLYWSAEGPKGAISPTAQIGVDRPGVFSRMVAADSTASLDVIASGTHYQQTADITDLVQTYGAGAFRVSNVATVSPVNGADQLLYAAWSVVVFYQTQAAPPRNLTVFEGFDQVAGGATVSAKLSGFLVPMTGFDAKLGVVAYEGNAGSTGDRISVNTQNLTNGLNPPTNFFNGTRSNGGNAVTQTGDLPQTNGQPDSLSGVDMDIVDITALVKAGDKSIDVAASTTNDTYFVGVLAGSVATLTPIFSESRLDYTNVTNPGGGVRPSDKLKFTVTTPNTGTDASVDTYVTIQLPPGLTYVFNSTTVNNGPNAGPKTDGMGDDQVVYDPVTRTLKVYVGTGATATKGGSVTTNDTPPSISFQTTVDPSANGKDIQIGGVITASGMVGITQGIPPASWNTGSVATPLDGPDKGKPVFFPNRPVSISVRECMTNLDCPSMMPRCDVSAFKCTNTCTNDLDCRGVPTGQICTPAKMCGCTKDSDCLSNSCDTATSRCRIPDVDLSITVRTKPNPPRAEEPVTHVITVNNNGPGTAPPGVIVVYDVPPGGTIKEINPGPDWQCSQKDRQITCTYNMPIPPGKAPDISIVVVPGPGQKTVDINTTVRTPSANDPNLENNVVTRSDLIGGPGTGEDQLAGGGFSCSVGPTAATRAQGLTFFALCSVLLLGLWRRRRLGEGR